ncbi:hypothetical protein [Streptomyces sp. NPDC059080]|uniref:hypothetical protein n=1 Tax=Streptomyces sp. NPDC059080 TaxID=3346718 RepID=UPI0036C078B3
MSNTQTMTYARVGAALEEAGAVAPEKVQQVLAEYAHWAQDSLRPYEVACALESFGIALSIHADDIDYLEPGYTYLLERAAELIGGAVTVTKVRLVEGDRSPDGTSRDDTLEFERNGIAVAVPAEHYSDEYYDHLAATEAIDALNPGGDDPRTFRYVDFPREKHGVYDTIVALVTPQQATALEKALGLVLR